ncbi:copper homeostasis protein CutC [Luteimonas sp. RD2P54]|uniref:PF03932 family protein CutC n=1 Tax=Luteimonas endophytica TaxID=3042023 RepID=A0ABT6JDX0_9GAMM|nr:copper homeostasis protein CutC [Luteimonas endophytica]MDH5825011.1 copper homeostasis protein CutC [Luteimonas endophytica]
MTWTLEIAANSLASAKAAQAAGATRVELCAALESGGLTPSAGAIAGVRKRVALPVHVLVRPRAGDFCYSDAEHETMLADIAHCAASGCDGVVVGALTARGEVDVARCRDLLHAAGALDTTFHRAIDLCPDMPAALEAIVGLGFRRVLSSGGATDAISGAGMLRRLVEQAGERIVVMPGAGITPDNIARLAAHTRAREFHASAKRSCPTRMRVPADPALGMDGGELRADGARIRALLAALHAAEAT